MEQKKREVKTIYTTVDGFPEVLFQNDPVPARSPNQKSYFRPYTRTQLSNVFRIMGCQMPLEFSLSDWIFNFLERATNDQAKLILNIGERKIFDEPRSCSSGYIILTRMEFHRLVTASLFVHQFRKIRYQVDFRLALDFHEERRYFIILLSGAPGTGKSTIASLLASRMSVSHIISTDSIRHAMRTMCSQKESPIIHCSTYECGDIVDPEHKLSEDERCIKGYNAQCDLVGAELMKVVSSFVESRSSLIVEGVHLSLDVLLKVVEKFPNVVPFLIYIKKEDFHRQRFAVRAKYMTTDPVQNRYISNFAAIRAVQNSLSKGASEHLIPKIDNRNIDRSIETMHQTLFSYLKKLEGRLSMFDPDTKKLTFLDSIWKRRKQKQTSKSKTLKAISQLQNCVEGEPEATVTTPFDEMMAMLPDESIIFKDVVSGNDISYNHSGTMILGTIESEQQTPPPTPIPPQQRVQTIQFVNQVPKSEGNDDFLGESTLSNAEGAEVQEITETEADPVELTLTDFAETTDFIETTDTETPETNSLNQPKFYFTPK